MFNMRCYRDEFYMNTLHLPLRDIYDKMSRLCQEGTPIGHVAFKQLRDSAKSILSDYHNSDDGRVVTWREVTVIMILEFMADDAADRVSTRLSIAASIVLFSFAVYKLLHLFF